MVEESVMAVAGAFEAASASSAAPSHAPPRALHPWPLPLPPLQFGTPEEDAHRRDFTINSLFYNINDGVIEDFTQQ